MQEQNTPSVSPSSAAPVFPVILSGGSGSRLWPLSRTLVPKQFLRLTDPKLSMLQATARRAQALPGAQALTLVCNEEHRFLAKEQLQSIAPASATEATLILEPLARNTAPAIALAALALAKTDPQALMLILPSDHLVEDETAFASAFAKAQAAALEGHLVTFGMQADHPATGYGYIQAGHPLHEAQGCHSVVRFVEKPDANTAAQFLKESHYYWNSGMFVFRADVFLAELNLYQPAMLAACRASMAAAQEELSFIRPDASAFSACPSQSVDYAIMQLTQKAAVVPSEFGWSDVGSWQGLWDISEKDEQGNAVLGDVYQHDTHNSYLRSESRLLAVIGLDNVVVVETPDAVLVMDKTRAQDIKHAIEFFRQTGRKEQNEHIRIYRPWGWYEGVDAGERFQVKRIMVHPGGRLSLQKHHHRAEHWIVVAGTAKVTNGEQTILLSENQSTYIPLGELHRLENPGILPLHLIEVQSGAYLGEDDIVRIEDSYGR